MMLFGSTVLERSHVVSNAFLPPWTTPKVATRACIAFSALWCVLERFHDQGVSGTLNGTRPDPDTFDRPSSSAWYLKQYPNAKRLEECRVKATSVVG